mmetsp:Transcript_29455/g.52944  ORF Transcript_29455/g.52944 Transcript_29455/m.52944 type:complete len:80 (-) Transcript_29455:347-586(-)
MPPPTMHTVSIDVSKMRSSELDTYPINSEAQKGAALIKGFCCIACVSLVCSITFFSMGHPAFGSCFLVVLFLPLCLPLL